MTLCKWLDSDPDPYNLIGSGSDQKVLSGSGSATLPTVQGRVWTILFEEAGCCRLSRGANQTCLLQGE